ncbi:MAG: PHP domain-containing protein [Acutalibacteraceae bacterium]|jgi:hypothetical protein
MKKYYYDLHIHSCLSPCADNASTPDSIAGMGKLNGLDILALTDHNTAKNCPAFFKAASRHGILPVAGMELTTAEEIHLVCLFPNLEAAMEFDKHLQERRILIENRADIFGEQLILDSLDNIIGTEKYLLSTATDISLDRAPALLEKYGAICYPAHIEREANGIISILGTFPQSPKFSCAEIKDKAKADEYREKYGLKDKLLIFSSDAHNLWSINEKTEFLLLDEFCGNSENAGEWLIKNLRGSK